MPCSLLSDSELERITIWELTMARDKNKARDKTRREHQFLFETRTRTKFGLGIVLGRERKPQIIKEKERDLALAMKELSH